MMNPMDPLSRLLRQWKPSNPSFSAERFTADTMREIRLRPKKSFPESWIQSVFDEWLPSPNVLVPVAAGVILLLTIFQWNGILQQTKNIVAFQWYEELSQPMAKVSLAGTYAQLEKGANSK